MAISASENEIFSTIRNGTRKNSSSHSIGTEVTAVRANRCIRSARQKLRNRSIML